MGCNMAKPITTEETLTPIDFGQRLQLVAEEINRRRTEANPTNATAFTANLWVRWIKRNLLDAPVRGGIAA